MSRPIDLEWLALERGLKPALRLAIDPKERAAIEARAAAAAAVIATAERAATIGGRELSVLYVSRDAARAREVRDAEALVLPGLPSAAPDERVLDAHRRTGVLLGYPPCCADAFAARVARGVTRREQGGEASEELVAAESAALRSARHDPRLNVVRRREVGALVAFHPCRLDCEAGIAIADTLLAALREHDRRAADALLAALSRPVAIALDGSVHEADAAPAGALVLRFGEP